MTLDARRWYEVAVNLVTIICRGHGMPARCEMMPPYIKDGMPDRYQYRRWCARWVR